MRQPLFAGCALVVFSACPSSVPDPSPQTAPSSTRMMLDELGFVTPPKDQGSRNSCTVFASVGAIEAEYKRVYGLTLDLSEEYMINMINETRPFAWVGGNADEKLFLASYYGLPQESAWPYVPTNTQVLALARRGVPNASSDDTIFGTALWNDLFERDLANYNPWTYPAAAVHEAAAYAPAEIVDVDASNAAALETVLAAGHTIAIGTATGAWQQDQSTGIFNYNAAGDQTGDHDVLLVGYDRTKQIFRIKNSWTSSWNGNGFAYFSYQLVTKVGWGAAYANGVHNPSDGALGTGVWRGFWRAIVNGKNGVVVVRHAYVLTTTSGCSQASHGCVEAGLSEAGDFYADDGSTASLALFLGGDAFSASFGDAQGHAEYQLSRKPGAEEATATEVAHGTETTWFKCNPQTPGSYPANLAPTTYAETANDTNVLPTCTP